MQKNIYTIPHNKKTATTILPDGSPHRSSMLSCVFTDDDNKIYIPVNEHVVPDFDLHVHKFVPVYCGDREEYYAEVPKHSQLIHAHNIISGMFSDLYKIRSLSDLDLAIYTENLRDCECLYSGKTTKWADSWTKLGNYHVREHKFYNSFCKSSLRKMIAKKDVTNKQVAYAFLPSSIVDIATENTLISRGIARIRTSTLSAEEVSEKYCNKLGLPSTRLKEFEVTNNTLKIKNHFGSKVFESASISIDSGRYSAVISDSTLLGISCNITLCSLDN